MSTSTRVWRAARAAAIDLLMDRASLGGTSWCEHCGSRPVGLQSPVHHRRLRSQGGRHSLENLLLLCEACHTWAHRHPRDARETGLIVSAYELPGEVPFKHALHDWVLLLTDGTVTPSELLGTA